MNVDNLLASVIQTVRTKRKLEQEGIKDNKERMLWWYNNTVGKKIRGSSYDLGQ